MPPPESTTELAKQYRPSEHEDRVRARWDESRAFHPDPARVLRGDARPYCVLIPPPNVTAALHLGHALNNTLQDVLVRARRMMGYETLWMVGTDHAGIATQAVVEKRVQKEEKKRRQDFSRDEFVAKIQAYKDEYEAVITGQLKMMGCSCDWERQRFTMDPVCTRAVREAFFRLFRDGLIYRGKRLVNWDPALQTAVADDECYEEELDSTFYYLRYPLVARDPAEPSRDARPVTWDELARRGYPGASDLPADQQAWVTVATTRPETYLGDTAVGVSPHDPRAVMLRGLFIELPLVGRVIPIIEDSYVVLPKTLARTDEEANDPKAEFATGFLKVTPAHDNNDYDLGIRHKLPMINMMSPDGRVSDKHGWSDVGDAHMFVGLKMAEARKKVLAEFESRGLLESTRPYRQTIKHSDRSKAVIEPYLSDQWYVKVTDPAMAPAANRALIPDQLTHHKQSVDSTDHQLRFHPDRYARTFEQWHDNIRDWCISRQLWWGHRIPVWTGRGVPIMPASDDAPTVGIAVAGLPAAAFCDSSQNTDVAAALRWTASSLASLASFGPMGGRPNASEQTVHVCLRHPDATITITADDIENSPRAAASTIKPGTYKAAEYLESLGYVQDSDVLDTWFSSALWPLSTLGWPDDTALLKAFNPSNTLCTAREIITLWVSRMVMFNRYLTARHRPGYRQESEAAESIAAGLGHVPFHNVFIHAVIQDGDGRKMSKSLGNGVDPLDIIATHGADAMRFTLCQMATNTQDVRLPVVKDSATGRNTSTKFDLGRNFCNKAWNATRFALGILAGQPGSSAVTTLQQLTLPDRWMLSRLAETGAKINQALDEFEFSVYAQTLYSFIWNDFCDWYLEAIKPTVAADAGQRAVLRTVLDATLRLLHPVSPFVTEVLFEHVSALPDMPVAGVTLGPARTRGLLCTAAWPTIDTSLRDHTAEEQFGRMRDIVAAIREVRAKQQTPPKRRITLHVPHHVEGQWHHMGQLLKTLAGLETVTSQPPSGPHAVFTYDAREYALSNLADAVDAGAERARLEKTIADCEKTIQTLESRLANPGYAERAPPHMVQQTKDQLAKAVAERGAAADALARLSQ